MPVVNALAGLESFFPCEEPAECVFWMPAIIDRCLNSSSMEYGVG